MRTADTRQFTKRYCRVCSACHKPLLEIDSDPRHYIKGGFC